MVETKEQKKERLYNYYTQNYNALPDFDCFRSTIQNPKDLNVFTKDSFIKYFYKKLGSQKDLIKTFKENKITIGSIVIDSLKVRNSNIEGQRWGYKKQNEIIQPFASSFFIKKGKSLKNKKTGLTEIQDFEIDSKNLVGNFHFMISNTFGCHVRKAEAYLDRFTDTSTKRKTYQVI